MFTFFGIFIIVGCLLLMFLPYVLGKTELLSAWNIVLLSILVFIGIGVLEVEYGDFHWEELRWFQPSTALKAQYMGVTSVFLAALMVFHYGFKFPQRLMANRLNKWPPVTTGVVFVVAGFGMLVALAQVFLPFIPVVYALILNISHKAVLFGTICAFVGWYRNRLSVPMLALFIGMYLFSILFCMYVSVGRRLLLSLVLSPAFCMYWMKWRYGKRSRNLAFFTTAILVFVVVAAFYSTFRHYRRSSEGTTFDGLLAQIKQTRVESVMRYLTTDSLHFAAQYSVWYSLLVMDQVDNNYLETKPLNSLAFIASYPVPRYFWPDKPVTIGQTIVPFLKLPYQTNWGVGITGHISYEGGLFLAVLYALLLEFIVRLLDDPIRRQPYNPFLMAILASSFPHLLAWTRGDIAIMTVEILEAVAYSIAVGLLARLFLGTAPWGAALTAPFQPRRRYTS